MKKISLLLTFLAALSIGTAWAGENGASEYNQSVRVTQLLKTMQTTLGQPIAYPQTDSAEVTSLLVELPPGKETGWHKHPVPGYGYILSGHLTLETEGGKTFSLDSGQAFAEVLDVSHNGKNLGTTPVKILVFFMGEKGKPYTEKEKKN